MGRVNKENLSKLFQESIDELKKSEDIFNKHIQERLRVLKLSQERTFQRFANKIMKLKQEVQDNVEFMGKNE